MREQRSGGRSRRDLLRAAGAVGAVGLAGVAGCVGSGGSTGTTDGSGTTGVGNGTDGSGGGGTSTTIAILAAGSLQNALSNGLTPAVDVPVNVEAHGSATVARMIDEGKRDPDIVSVADAALFEDPLSPLWYSVFTSNAVVIAYNPDTEGGKRLAEAGSENWYDALASDDVRIGRTDPDQDPLGYRALFTLELASRYYDDASNLKKRLLQKDQIFPETALISQFESGSIDAAIAYRNMAVERDYEYIELPDQIDLSNPQYDEEWYSTVSYTLPSDQTIQGGLISYGSTIRKMSDTALDVFAAHTTGDYLDEHGFLLRDQFPMYEGDVPQRVQRATGGSGGSESGGTQSAGNRSGSNETAGTRSALGGSPVELSAMVSDITLLI
ncbi:sulfate/thiosulfate/molybdate ABC transporter substrate-binding protein [Halococcus morrhuae DSM 1307]|uniref:Sulfate/thiosulfate/molybdate ABC transporter substrate-binding protein n=1 Tax=Halococcus morrhuae DSM 1307 TaxID=931277 RepID=M0MT12_HALMO|nr:extracellular solute-binding protein [Halococcus morrhuae]EMA47585.1 sulfate/thiosulfate/molybdate ABC transporter substrate-binding protein [Halococcus morrhuae DSM 1307]